MFMNLGQGDLFGKTQVTGGLKVNGIDLPNTPVVVRPGRLIHAIPNSPFRFGGAGCSLPINIRPGLRSEAFDHPHEMRPRLPVGWGVERAPPGQRRREVVAQQGPQPVRLGVPDHAAEVGQPRPGPALTDRPPPRPGREKRARLAGDGAQPHELGHRSEFTTNLRTAVETPRVGPKLAPKFGFSIDTVTMRHEADLSRHMAPDLRKRVPVCRDKASGFGSFRGPRCAYGSEG